jgi:tetratricopeptide (TPR) repeat protein
MSRSAIRFALFLALGWAVPAEQPALAAAGETGIAESVASTFKAGMNKVAEVFTPKKPAEETPDPISLAIKAKPSAELYVAAARVAEQAGKAAEAESNYQQALKLDPRHLPALVNYARLKDRQGDLTGATALYQEAAKLYPKEASVFNDLGLCFERRKMFREAAAALQQAVRLQPDRGLYRNNLAVVLVEMGDLDGAFIQFRTVHGEAVAYYNVAYLLQKQGRTKDAARLFVAALEKDPSLVEAKIWLEKLGGQLEVASQQTSTPRIAQRTSRPDVVSPASPAETSQVYQLPAVSPMASASAAPASIAPLPPMTSSVGAASAATRMDIPSGPAVSPPENRGLAPVQPLPPVLR